MTYIPIRIISGIFAYLHTNNNDEQTFGRVKCSTMTNIVIVNGTVMVIFRLKVKNLTNLAIIT